MRQEHPYDCLPSECPSLPTKKEERELEDIKTFLSHIFLLTEVHKEENIVVLSYSFSG